MVPLHKAGRGLRQVLLLEEDEDPDDFDDDNDDDETPCHYCDWTSTPTNVSRVGKAPTEIQEKQQRWCSIG